jgi:hypothetical protein
MTISSLTALTNGIKYTGDIPIYSASVANQVSGGFTSRWKSVSGNTWPAGTNPTTSAICTSATTGAPLINLGANDSYISRVDLTSGIAGSVFLYDRLVAIGGLSGTTSASTASVISLVPAVAQNRCLATGEDVDWFLEWYTTTGSTAVTATITYTNQADTSGQTTTVSIAASSAAARMYRITPSNAADFIKSIQSISLSASTGTAGNYGITAGKRLTAGLGYPLASSQVILDFMSLGFPHIVKTSCLWIVQIPNATTSGTLIGSIQIAGS